MNNPFIYKGKFDVWALWSFRQFGFELSWSTLIPCTDVEYSYEIVFAFLFLKIYITKIKSK